MKLIYLAERTVFGGGLELMYVAGCLSMSRLQSLIYCVCVCACSLMATMIAKMPSIGRGCPIRMLNLVARWCDSKRCERDIRGFLNSAVAIRVQLQSQKLANQTVRRAV